MKKNKYNPRASVCRATPPGVMLEEYIAEGQISVQQLAEGLGISIYHVLCILEGRIRMTPMIAEKLGPLLGMSPQVWLNLQHYYDTALAETWGRRRMKS